MKKVEIKVSHVLLIAELKLNWFQGEILKYVSLFKFNNGESDLDEAISIANMAINMKVGEKLKKPVKFTKLVYEKKPLKDLIEDYRNQFDYDEYINVILIGLVESNYSYVKESVIKLKDKYYGKKKNPTN